MNGALRGLIKRAGIVPEPPGYELAYVRAMDAIRPVRYPGAWARRAVVASMAAVMLAPAGMVAVRATSPSTAGQSVVAPAGSAVGAHGSSLTPDVIWSSIIDPSYPTGIHESGRNALAPGRSHAKRDRGRSHGQGSRHRKGRGRAHRHRYPPNWFA